MKRMEEFGKPSNDNSPREGEGVGGERERQ